MRTFTREHRYDAPARHVVLLWRDPEFLAAVGERFGGVGVAEIEEDGDRVVVVTRRELPLDKVPSFVRRFIQSGLLEQRDVWPREAEPPVAGEWVVTGKMPATMSGRQHVVPDGDGCSVEVTGSIDVSAPLVGGKIEELISKEITKLIRAQQDFAGEWLAGREQRTA
jgi:hypothetical protein